MLSSTPQPQEGGTQTRGKAATKRLNLEHAAVRCWIIQGIVPQQKSTNTGHPIAVYTFEGRCKEIIIV